MRALSSPAVILGVVSCVFALGVVVAGFLLAEHQGTVLTTEQRKSDAETALLINELKNARLAGPRLRLEELAALPLIPEFVELSRRQPDGLEAQELGAYLRAVLEAASSETGLARIAIVDAEGRQLLSADSLISNETTEESHRLAAIVYDINDPAKAAGKIAGYVPKTAMSMLLPSDTNSPTRTAGISSSTSANASTLAVLDIPGTTRLLSLVAGIAIAFFGLSGAVLLRWQILRKS
ncbi:hypothetical protein [Labrenzia sp. DG1229]|uniref:hypothetical protein n=1 Tax=Labrenzia sp. DG1229 TaxID=681847 RepID=UPI00048D18B1|nr:hypothetical protein [Labrenzia sp. DG1229]